MEVMLLHGLGQGSAAWDGVVSALPDSISADCPDLFALAKGERMDYPALYRAVSDYCGTRGERGLHLCGLSLGAVLALHYALDNPEAVKSLVLIAGRARMPRALLQVQSGLFRLMGEQNFREMGLSKADAIALTASMARLDFRRDLSRVPCPILVLCGERDGANRREAAALAAGIPGAGLAFLPGAGHEVNRDAPQALAEALEQFYGTLRMGKDFGK